MAKQMPATPRAFRPCRPVRRAVLLLALLLAPWQLLGTEELAFAARGAAKTAAPAKPASAAPAPTVPPKRAMNAFMHYSQKERPAVQQKFPGDVKAVAEELGKSWKNLDTKARAKWAKAAEEDKKRYQTELEAFLAGGGTLPARKSSKKAAKEAKEAKAPRPPRAPSAYILYVKEKMPAEKAKPQYKDAKITEVMKAIAEQWRAASAKDKKKFEDAAAKAKAKLAQPVA
jgi:hypothetical protein